VLICLGLAGGWKMKYFYIFIYARKSFRTRKEFLGGKGTISFVVKIVPFLGRPIEERHFDAFQTAESYVLSKNPDFVKVDYNLIPDHNDDRMPLFEAHGRQWEDFLQAAYVHALDAAVLLRR
jgi:hypothetical protein